jgi:hypothetical protein
MARWQGSGTCPIIDTFVRQLLFSNRLVIGGFYFPGSDKNLQKVLHGNLRNLLQYTDIALVSVKSAL